MDPVPQAGDKVGNGGWVLKYDIVSQTVKDLLWNTAVQTIKRCIAWGNIT